MPTVIDPKQYFIGAGDVYYRAVGASGAWASIGATVDDIVARISQTWFQPDLNGQLGPVRELDYLASRMAEAEFTMAEIAGSKLALAVPGALSTTLATTDAGGTPLVTTLAAAANPGDVTVKVVAITNAAAGDYIRINVAGALAEYRQITVVGTVGAGGTGLQFRDALQKTHANGVAVVETVGDGKTEVTGSSVRRQPLSAYNDWAIVGQSPNGYSEFLLYNAISVADAIEIGYGDETVAGAQVTIQAREDGTNTVQPWKLRLP